MATGERLRAHRGARPWTVKVYTASVPASFLLLLIDEPVLDDRQAPWVALLLLWGVWMGFRMAWLLSLVLSATTLVAGLVATRGGPFLFVPAFCSIWVGLLVADPTRRWIAEREREQRAAPREAARPDDRTPGGGRMHPLRAQWLARPPTLRILVAALLASTAYSLVVHPGSPTVWDVLFTIVFLGLLKKLWDGERAMWWLFVILTASGVAGGLTRAREEPSILVGTAVAAVGLTLLVVQPTRSWIARQSGGPIP